MDEGMIMVEESMGNVPWGSLLWIPVFGAVTAGILALAACIKSSQISAQERERARLAAAILSAEQKKAENARLQAEHEEQSREIIEFLE